MAEKRAYKTLIASIERKAKDLSEYVKSVEAVDRVVTSKHDKLAKDVASLEETVGRLVATSEGASDDILKKQEEVNEVAAIALEGAEEFLTLNEFKNDVMNKELEVLSVCQSVGCKLKKINEQILEQKTTNSVLSKQKLET